MKKLAFFKCFVKISEGKHTKRSLDLDIPFIAQCEFQQCVRDLVRILPMR